MYRREIEVARQNQKEDTMTMQQCMLQLQQQQQQFIAMQQLMAIMQQQQSQALLALFNRKDN